MNRRTPVLILAVALIGVGLALTVRDLVASSPPPATIVVAHAVQQVEPYTLIDQNMIAEEDMTASEARDVGAWPADQIVGMMAAGLVRDGDLLTAANVQSLDDYRESPDMSSELVSFAASIDRLVAGQIKPGHRINIYGISRQAGPEGAYTVLIEPNVRVIRVFAGGGQLAGAGTPVPDWTSGEVAFSQRNQAGSLVTVALVPEKAYHLIDAIGAQGLQPYVTLAGSRTVRALATPPARVADAPATPVDIAATITAVVGAMATPFASPPGTGG